MKKIKKNIREFFRPSDKTTTVKWSLYGRVWREIGRPQWKWLLGGIICTLISAGFEAFSVTLVKQVIDVGFIEKSISSLYIIGIQIVAAFGGKSIFKYADTLMMAKAGLLAITRLRRRVYRHMIKMHIGMFGEAKTGILINYYTLQSAAVQTLVTSTIIDVVRNTATLFMMLGLMIYYAPQMVATLLFMVPAIMIPIIIIMRKNRKLTRNAFSVAGNYLSHVAQTLQGVKTIQSFGAEDSEAAKYERIEDDTIGIGYKQTQLGGLQSPILETLISVGLCMALIMGGVFIANGSISTGDFAAFILALTAAYKPAKAVTGINGTVQAGLIAAEQLFDFLDKKSEIVDAKGAVQLKRAKMNVKFDNVHFAYNTADGEILRGIDLDVPAGNVCAFVGPSGGGKTTMFNLIERFYDPQKGKVLINGKDIKKYTLKSLRTNIAEVSQDVFLFGGSISDNIGYGMPGATQAQVEAAARAANAHDFIMDLPKKYNTQVGERGVLLSGGQKQRIAIARAILKDAPILLLDEATSALDTESEKLIQSALKDLMKGRTTFVIAHRLSTILDADQICVIKSGKIVERGTDAELVAMKGEYKKLRDIQFKKKDVA